MGRFNLLDEQSESDRYFRKARTGLRPGGPQAVRNGMSFSLLQKINTLASFPRIEDKSPFHPVFVYPAPNLSGADRSAPVFKR
jgi:hypothetical protein